MSNKTLVSVSPAFYKPLDVGKRPWGSECLVAMVPDVATLKVLHIRAGSKGRLQRHHRKDEAGYLMRGQMIVRYVEDGKLKPRIVDAGQSFHFPIGCIHQEEAVTDCLVLEVSTPFGNDRVGHEEDFHLPVPEDALPSTEYDDVTEWDQWWE